MKKYRIKITDIYAKQFSKVNLGSLDIWVGGPVHFGCTCGLQEACEFCGRHWIMLGGGGRIALQEGDWITKSVETGEYFVMSNEDFLKIYSEVKE